MVFILFFGLFNMYNCRAGEELCWCYAFVGEHIKIRVDDQASSPGSPDDFRVAESSGSDDVPAPALATSAASSSFSVSLGVPTSPLANAFETPRRGNVSRDIENAEAGQAQPLFLASQFDEVTTDEEEVGTDEEEETQFSVGDSITIMKGGVLVHPLVTGRVVGKKSKKVIRYITRDHGVITAIEIVRPSEGVETEGNVHDNDDGVDGGNPSAVYAVNTASSGGAEVLALELSETSTAPMSGLWKLFNNPTFRGGVLARSLFCQAAKEKDTQVLPSPWTGGTSLKTTIAEKRVQEQQWLNWTDNDVVNEWVRRRVFSIVIANPRPHLIATWKGRSTQMAVHGAASIVVTESHRCRIAHLAVDTKAKMLINLIYGSKAERSDIEDNELRVAQLWTEVANEFVNAQSWTPFENMSLGTSSSIYSDIDVSACPANPGLDAATIKEIWMELRTDWSRLNVAITSKTGASVMATGSVY